MCVCVCVYVCVCVCDDREKVHPVLPLDLLFERYILLDSFTSMKVFVNRVKRV